MTATTGCPTAIQRYLARRRGAGRPLVGEEDILYAEIDARRARASRQEFDPVGHYGRSDVLRLVVDTTPRPAVSFGRDETAEPAPHRPGEVD